MDTASHHSPRGRPPRITQYWNTEDVPSYLAPLFDSFSAQNPDFAHEVFSESAAEHLIRQSLSARELAAFKSCAIPAMQADYFRYCAVLALGGIYSDADYRCASSLEPLLEQDAAGELFCRPETYVLDGQPLHRVLNGFFGFEQPGHPLLRLALDIATANLEERVCERVWGAGEKVRESIWMTVGPGIFTILHYLNVLGSFDRLLRVAADTAAAPFMDLYCEVIGNPVRVASAFQDVRVSPFSDLWLWVAHPEAPLPYKDTSAHWKNATTAIFR